MKRIVLLSALALICGAGVLRLLQHDAGYVLIAIAGKTIEMRFWFAILLVFGVAALVIWFVKTLLMLIRSVSGGWSLAMANRARRGERRTSSGLIQFIEGDWLGAQKTLLKAAKDVDDPLVHYLAAARSTYELGRFNEAESLIEKAQQIAPEHHVSIAISQGRMLFLKGKFDECLSVLHNVKTAAPNNPVILSLLQSAYLATNDWTSLETLLPSLERNSILPSEELQVLQQKVYMEMLNATTDAESLWQHLPKHLKSIPELLVVYARILLQSERHNEVEQLLRQTLKKQWIEELVEIYGLSAPSDVKTQLQTAEAWLKSHGSESAVLNLALGRICLRSELWGQAKDYFQSSINIQPTPSTYAELARLQSALGEEGQSQATYQQGLLSAVYRLPSLPLP